MAERHPQKFEAFNHFAHKFNEAIINLGSLTKESVEEIKELRSQIQSKMLQNQEKGVVGTFYNMNLEDCLKDLNLGNLESAKLRFDNVIAREIELANKKRQTLYESDSKESRIEDAENYGREGFYGEGRGG